jgi:hypothetical protein
MEFVFLGLFLLFSFPFVFSCDCVNVDCVTLKQTHSQGEEMKVNVRKEAQLKSEITGEWLELDIWLPRLNLAFEYQVFPLFFLFFFFFSFVSNALAYFRRGGSHSH